jgi:hypothetical protein
MAQSSLSIPVLANNPQDRLGIIKESIVEARELVDRLRRQVKAGDPAFAPAEDLRFVLQRLAGDVNRLALVL